MRVRPLEEQIELGVGRPVTGQACVTALRSDFCVCKMVSGYVIMLPVGLGAQFFGSHIGWLVLRKNHESSSDQLQSLRGGPRPTCLDGSRNKC